MSRKRKAETENEREKRLRTNASERLSAEAKEAERVDAMVRDSIERHGP